MRHRWQRYDSLRERLVSNVTDLDECWIGQEKSLSSYGYCRVNLWIPGLGVRHFSAHILLWVVEQSGATTVQEAFLAYHEFRCSGLELDHTCNEVRCRRPDHLEPVTREENERRKHERRKKLKETLDMNSPPDADYASCGW